MRSSRTGDHLGARDGGEQPLAQGGQHVPAAAQRGPGGAGQGHALQQRHDDDQLVRARLLQRQVSGPLRPDVEGQLGQELGQVQAHLQVAGGHVAVARVEQHHLVIAGQQDAVGGQRPVRDPVLVQHAHGVPDVPQLGIGAPGLALGQRRPVVVVVGEHGGFGSDPDHRPQPGGGRARVFGRVGQQRPALHGPVRRQGRAAGDLPAQQERPVQPVEGAGGLLVLVVDGDVQPVAGCWSSRRSDAIRPG